MRFEHVRIARYGRLVDVATPDPLPSLVVVLGPNESGKSTFFSFLCDLMQGFAPASAERHPYTPWSGGEAEGEARIRLDDGSVMEVRRRLGASGRGVVAVHGRDEDLGNRPLRAAAHVGPKLFRQVYALNLFELARLEDESWNVVQDRLVAAMGDKGLRSAREAAEELEAAASRLWRPDRRGRPLARRLGEDMADLKQAMRRALEGDAELRAREAARIEAEEALARVRAEQEEARAERAEIEAALARRAAKAERLREEERQAVRRLESLDREAAACGTAVADYENGPQGAIAADADRVRRAVALLKDLPGLERAAEETAAAERQAAARCQALAGELLTVASDEIDAGGLAGVDLDALVERVRACERARTRSESERESAADGSGALMRLPGAMRPGRRGLVAGTALLAAGGLLAGWRLLQPETVLLLGGGVTFGGPAAISASIMLALTGAILLVMRADAVRRYKQYRRAVAAAESKRSERLASLERREKAARDEVAEVLAGVPVRPALLEAPAAELATGIQRLTAALERVQDHGRERAARAADVARARAELDGIRRRLEAATGASGAFDAASLSATLDAALEARELARGAARRLEAMGGERVGAEQERAAAKGGIDALEQDDGDDLPGRLDACKERRNSLIAQSEEIGARIAAVETELRHLRERETAAQAGERIEGLRATMQGVLEDRDRAFVLARLVREADRRFREAHQPDLLARAGGYLGAITRGRYDRVEMDPGEVLGIRRAADGEVLSVGEATSQGTREQVYMAMRLAMVDHLDAGHESLPLFLDETLVNWDAWRRDGALDLIEEVAERRQVFAFTCHPAVAAEMEDRGAAVLALKGPSAPAREGSS